MSHESKQLTVNWLNTILITVLGVILWAKLQHIESVCDRVSIIETRQENESGQLAETQSELRSTVAVVSDHEGRIRVLEVKVNDKPNR